MEAIGRGSNGREAAAVREERLLPRVTIGTWIGDREQRATKQNKITGSDRKGNT